MDYSFRPSYFSLKKHHISFHKNFVEINYESTPVHNIAGLSMYRSRHYISLILGLFFLPISTLGLLTIIMAIFSSGKTDYTTLLVSLVLWLPLFISSFIAVKTFSKQTLVIRLVSGTRLYVTTFVKSEKQDLWKCRHKIESLMQNKIH